MYLIFIFADLPKSLGWPMNFNSNLAFVASCTVEQLTPSLLQNTYPHPPHSLLVVFIDSYPKVYFYLNENVFKGLPFLLTLLSTCHLSALWVSLYPVLV